MSLSDITVSKPASKRISSFSVGVWLVGTIALLIGSLSAFDNVGIGDDGFGALDADRPWEQEEPAILTADGDVYSGTGSGLISIPLEEHDGQPYLVNLVDGENVDLYRTRPEDLGRPADDRGYPDNIAYMYEPGSDTYVIPPDADLELWVRAEGDWSFTMARAEVHEMTTGYSTGSGNGLLLYRGDAVSALFTHSGDGTFFVTIQTADGESEQPIIDSGDVDQRVSWDPTDSVFITIESDIDRGVWSVDIDELADAPREPSPDPISPTRPAPTGPAEPAAFGSDTTSPPTTSARSTRGTP